MREANSGLSGRQPAAGRDLAIRIQDVSFSYGPRRALEGVSFSVGRSQLFGLVGPNGGGKTTLFRILCTLLVPQGGGVEMEGIDVVRDPARARRCIGVVFQTNSLDLHLTSEENLRYQGSLYGLRGKLLQDRVEALMDRFELLARRRDRANQLSGGLRRRLELAKALLHRPRILLLDEPTLGLDPGIRRDFWKYLQDMRDDEGITVLFTTHLMEETERCDSLVILSDGQVVAEGTPDSLKDQIGGDVVVVRTDQPERLCQLIQQRFGGAPEVLDGTVRLARSQGHELVAELMEGFPDEIESITVGKPTLEDVFVHQTGHRFNHR